MLSQRTASDGCNVFRHAVRLAGCAAGVCLVILAGAPAANAHGRAATVALDYRLPLDPGVGNLDGVRASILDGDRSLRLAVDRGRRVVVLGDLGEPMLRLDGGVWVNRDSPTAQANRLVRRSQKGWKKVADGRTFAWHEHRLAPPPFVAGQYGSVARWRVPLVIDGRRTAVSGAFWRVPRPAFWPWALGALGVAAVAVIAMAIRPRVRVVASLGAGTVAGVAGLIAESGFALKDAPSGRIAWALLVAAFALAAIAVWAMAVTRGLERAFVGGVIGVAVLVFCLSWVGVFFHGAVVSALPASAVRLVCAVAFSSGLVSLVGVVWIGAPAEADAT